MSFNYQHLYYFYRAAQSRSFSDAAKALHISQPALSMQLKQFENYWGFPLFHREKKQASLTEQGKILVDYAKAIFDLGEQLEASLLGVKTEAEAPRIRIGVSAAVPKAVAGSLLSCLYRSYPGIRLSLRQDSIESMVEALSMHKMDLVVNDAPYKSEIGEGFQNHLAARIPMVFCISPRLAKKLRTMPEDLDGAPLILPTTPDRTYHAMQNYIHINKVKPVIAAEVQDLGLMRFLVAEGKGIGLLNAYDVKHSPKPGKLKILEDRSEYKIEDTIYLIKKHRKKPNPFVEYLIEHWRLDL